MPEATGAGAAAARETRGHARRWLAAALVAGFALRLAFGLVYWVGKPLTLDEQEYLLLAHNVAGGRGFSYASPSSGAVEGRHVGRAPLYPLLLAGVGLAWPGSAIVADRLPEAVPTEVKVTQAAVGCAIIWLIAWWAGRIAGRRASLAAAWIAAVYPPLVAIAGYALSESLYAALALLAALLLDRAYAASRPGLSAGVGLLAGVATGLAALTRPAVLPFLGLAVLWLIARRRVWLVAALVVGAVLVVAPWTARNQRVHGRFVLIASEGGVTFWTGNNRLARGEGDLAANLDMKRAALDIERAAGSATPEALEGVFYRAAFDDIRSDPARFAALLARKAFYTVVPGGPSYALHSSRYVAASVVPYLAVLPFALWGAWRCRGSRPRPVPLWLLAAGACLVCIIFFPQERFRIPVIDPVLIVYAAACAPAAWPRGQDGARRT